MESVYSHIGVFIFGLFTGAFFQSWILRKADRVQREDRKAYFETLRLQIDKLLTINGKLSNKIMAKDISSYAGLTDLDNHQQPQPTVLHRPDDIEFAIEQARLGELNERR